MLDPAHHAQLDLRPEDLWNYEAFDAVGPVRRPGDLQRQSLLLQRHAQFAAL